VTLLKPKLQAQMPTPRRILLINPAHIGDVVISTSLFPVLKSAYPGVEIGFLCGSWAQGVVSGHPLVQQTHCIDHWRMNRQRESLFGNISRYLRTRRVALREIKTAKYDVAISLHAGFPDLIDIAWQAAIPVRVAFNRVLLAPLANVLATYPENNAFMHHAACQAELLRNLGIPERAIAQRKSSLREADQNDVAEIATILGVADIKSARFVIIHMGSGERFKEMPIEFWREIAESLSKNTTLLFTGRGDMEARKISVAIEGLGNCVNACDRLSWRGFVAAVQHADTLYGVDSLAGHVAAAVGTRSVTVYHGAAGPARWRPESPKATIWTNTVECSPCNRIKGCPEMRCLRQITPKDILQLETLLRRTSE
jgi:ADP-heptose:LPS heptosyltransferase